MEELLKIKKMKVQYGDFAALNISQEITFNAGDRIGIIGTNGAGKSTFVKALCGLANYSGEVCTKLKTHEIAIHMQENAYIKRMSVKTILEAVLNTDIKNNEKLKTLIEYLEFNECLKKKYGQLSGGQKQKLTIIIILFQDKQLTFFDEVTSALDFETRQKLMIKINDWYKDKSSTVCVVSHYYDELENLCNKLLIIDKGKVIDFGDIDSLFKKYCGQSIITIKKNAEYAELTKQFNQITAPEHLIAFKCLDNSDEKKLINILVKNNIAFKRSDKDIEILFINIVRNGGQNEDTPKAD